MAHPSQKSSTKETAVRLTTPTLPTIRRPRTGKAQEAGGCLDSPVVGSVLLFTPYFRAALLEYLVASRMKPRDLMADLWGEMPPFNCPHDCSENRVFYSKLNSVNVPNINE